MAPRYPIKIPALVDRAKALAEELGFDLRPEGTRAGAGSSGPSACTDGVGRLLQTLAATVRGGRIGEVGTGAGVGAAWLASGMGSGSTLHTVDPDPRLAHAARELFDNRDDVTVIIGDWLEVSPSLAPFDLLFFDGGGRDALKRDNLELIANLVVPGGLMILDDLTPEEHWPESWRGKPDPKRDLAFESEAFTSAELRTGPARSVLLMARRQDHWRPKSRRSGPHSTG